MSRARFSRLVLSAALLAATAGLAGPARGDAFGVTNLVTDDQTANHAQLTDPSLKNGWGISSSATSPFWVSANGTGTSVLYKVDPTTNAVTKQGLEVTIPGAGNVTGQVFNGTSAFNSDLFLFASEDGTISGWRGALGTTAETLVLSLPGNSYKGLGVEVTGGFTYLLAANFATATINVFPQSGAPDLAGKFTDPAIPAGFAPFNVQNLGGTIYVTYAVVGSGGDDVAGPGNGIVSAFDLQGNFLGRIATGGTLNSPWGLAIAPASFGSLAGDLLVGNFGDGRIGAFDLSTHTLESQLLGGNGLPLEIDGLWGLSPGNGGNGGSPSSIYFAAGPGDEQHGLFGVIAPIPEPATAALLLGGLAAAAGAARRRRARLAAARA